jgi:ABC-2 type transport system ATP-binding protein
MQRRLNIAAGLLHHPAVLLLDEPTVGVDPNAREHIYELLRALRSEGLAILIATHDLEQAETLADRIAILDQGRIRAEGTPASLVKEVLGDARELAVTLSADPDADGREQLAREGLAPVRGDRAWAGRLAGGLSDLSAISGRLAAAGLAVSEMRVREPGLRGVFFRLTGENLDP